VFKSTRLHGNVRNAVYDLDCGHDFIRGRVSIIGLQNHAETETKSIPETEIEY